MITPQQVESDAGRIKTVLLPYTRNKIGGSHISGLTLGTGLQARFGVRCIVAAPVGAQVLSLAKEMGLETISLGDKPAGRWRPHYDVIRSPARMKILRQLGKGSIIHCNDLSSFQAWLLPAKLMRRPIIFHARALDRRFWPYDLIRRCADHVIAISAACDATLRFIPEPRRNVLVNPFSLPVEYDASNQRKAILRELDAPPGARLVGFVANFWHRKRPIFFLEVAAQLAAGDPTLRFVVFGREGEIGMDAISRHIERLGLTERTVLAGFRLPPEANIAALDLLLAPAFGEPFGRTLVEALLMGIPYVATDDAGHSEIHARWGGGLVLPKEIEAEAYARAAAEVLRDAGRVALSLDRRKEIAASLSPERHAELVMAIYARLMGEMRPPA